MLKIENFEVIGWEHAIRGMRNPMNSWDKSDSFTCYETVGHTKESIEATCGVCPKTDNCDILDYKPHHIVGNADHTLMMNLAKGGPVHAKYRRMIAVYLDVTAPLYWWKEFDTYKVGTVRNSCSTMHKIHSKKFAFEDFSTEHLSYRSINILGDTIDILNDYRAGFIEYEDGCTYIEHDGRIMSKKDLWWQMIQLLPSSYNQRATIMLNYEVLVGIYRDRKNHKLDEWKVFCDWISELPYSELIIGERD